MHCGMLSRGAMELSFVAENLDSLPLVGVMFEVAKGATQ
jgi:hypothetical protein